MTDYKPKNRLAAQAYIDGILSGDRVILSRAITIIESQLESDKVIAKTIIQAILPASGKSIRIGITGVPGVGKSTFIEAFGKHIINQGLKVAVLSIDPSSQRSKGSILGDKTRMEALSTLESAFIRPSASGNTLGGVANKTAESMLLCEAAGYNVVLIETVGVGQSETAVHGMTDFFLLLMLAGAGDELQGIKKGIMEMADMLVINKADGDNIKKSEQTCIQYQNALHIFPLSESGWETVVTIASSIKNTGIDTVWKTILNHQALVNTNGYFTKNRQQQNISWMHNTINNELKQLFYGSEAITKELSILEKDVISSKISPLKAANRVIEMFKKRL